MIVEDIQNRPEFVLISDSQDVRAVIEYLIPTDKVEDTISEVGCIFAEIRDGDYGEVLFSPYSVPYLGAPLYNLVNYFTDEHGKCEHCGAATSFERSDPKTQPPEGEVCTECGDWICKDCVDWKESEHDAKCKRCSGLDPLCDDCTESTDHCLRKCVKSANGGQAL